MTTHFDRRHDISRGFPHLHACFQIVSVAKLAMECANVAGARAVFISLLAFTVKIKEP